jgi:hypothetical protein
MAEVSAVLRMGNIPLYMHTRFSLITHPLMEIYIGLCDLALVNNAAMNIRSDMFLR